MSNFENPASNIESSSGPSVEQHRQLEIKRQMARERREQSKQKSLTENYVEFKLEELKDSRGI